MSSKKDEKILVIKRELLFAASDFQGFLPMRDFRGYQDLIMRHKQFLWRSAMETDPTYKQIIPYLIFRHANTYFLMRRRSNASETRLKNKYSLGIGGHIRQEDMVDSSLVGWAQREFSEEVNYKGSFTVRSLGLINDDSTAVGQVHIGFVFLLEGDSAQIRIKDEHKEGSLLILEHMRLLYKNMEIWSQLTFDYLRLYAESSKHAKCYGAKDFCCCLMNH